MPLLWQEGNTKVQTFGKRCHSARRDPNCPVVIRGWLNKKVLLQIFSDFIFTQSECVSKFIWKKPIFHFPLEQDSAGLKLWKRRWFVLSNYCLFYYKGTQLVLHSVCHPELYLYNSASVLFLTSSPVQPQTVEKNLYWAAFHFRATKSCSAHPENARTGSSPSRYWHYVTHWALMILEERLNKWIGKQLTLQTSSQSDQNFN